MPRYNLGEPQVYAVDREGKVKVALLQGSHRAAPAVFLFSYSIRCEVVSDFPWAWVWLIQGKNDSRSTHCL